MIMMSKIYISFFTLMLTIFQCNSFVVNVSTKNTLAITRISSTIIRSSTGSTKHTSLSLLPPNTADQQEPSSSNSIHELQSFQSNQSAKLASSTRFASLCFLSLPLFLQQAANAFVLLAINEDDMEVTDLPPPYVPIIVAFVILGGVGWLTSSLGDVMSEEASLGMMSGAKAKKEAERSRSSYFKNK